MHLLTFGRGWQAPSARPVFPAIDSRLPPGPFVGAVPKSTPPPDASSIRSTADFARYVGLARTTVSRVLNEQPGLKQKTIDKVQRAMHETGFTPNAHALHLRGKRTSTIGICMETLATPPAVQKLSSMQGLFRERHYSSLIEVIAPGDSKQVVRHFMSMRVEAVVFIGHFVEEEVAERIRELNAHGTPHVVMDQAGIPDANTVTLDRASGMAKVVSHLTDLGHSSFGLLGLSGSYRSVRDRVSGIESALIARGMNLASNTRSLDHLHVRANDFEYGRLLGLAFASEKKPPTALIALNDEIAIGAIRGLQEAGLKVPQDISVAGFNNQDICVMPTPRLTSVDQQIEATISAASELILSQIGQPLARRPTLTRVEPLLVVRESTAQARR